MKFHRDLQPEAMDDPSLPDRAHRDALDGLGRLNRATGVSGSIYKRLRRYALGDRGPLRILDLATGGGDLPIRWATAAARERIAMRITGIDFSPRAVHYARRQAEHVGADVTFLQRDCLNDRIPTGFDVVTCSLFVHHLNVAQLQRLLSVMQSCSERAVLICDLERTRLNLAAVWFASRVLSRSEVVRSDAIRSVRSAWTREEFCAIAEPTLGRPVRVMALPPCRYLAVIDDAVVKVPEAELTPALQAT